MDVNAGAAHICATLQRGKPCLIGRNGSTEMQLLFHGATSEGLRKQLELYSGVFPSTEESIRAWGVAYKAALGSIDSEPIVAGWYTPMKAAEERILNQHCISETYIPLRSLEPYYAKPSNRWTNLLAGKKVAVVSSFAKTIEKQLLKKEVIWGIQTNSLLPHTTEWFPVQTGYPPVLAQGRAGWPEDVNTWQEAVAYLTDEVMKTGAEVCIIGCGGIGMILGAELKRKGLQCVVLGGATQVLFGIKGRRWAAHDIISKFWTDAWVWPSLEETPGGAASIEGGCYWSDEVPS